MFVGRNPLPAVASIKSGFLDTDFYLSPRCFIFDDLTDLNMAYKIYQRTNLFYIAYSISKGLTTFYPSSSPIDNDEYAKKCLWYLYFSTTRLKKLMFTWSFRPFRKNVAKTDSAIQEVELPSREIILHVPFYVSVREGRDMAKDDPLYCIRVQYQEPTR